EFEMLHDLDRIHRGRGHVIMVLLEARGGAVVDHEAVLAQHHAVAGLTDGERRESVAIDAVEEGVGVAALHVDLAKRRDIAHADMIADIRYLPVHRVLRLLASARVIERAEPRPGLDEHGSPLFGPLMRWGKSRRAKIRPAVMTGKRADGDRVERRAEGGGADRTKIPPGEAGEHGRA